MFYDLILKEVLSQKQFATYVRIRRPKMTKYKTVMDKQKRGAGRRTKMYWLGEKYYGVYFTQREAECVCCFLKGCTNQQTAQQLCLSTRTVEFYVDNMKKKLNCRTKSELMQCVSKSDFVEQATFII